MNLQKINDYILRISVLEICLATILIFMPFGLRWMDNWCPWRKSISNYVYTDYGHIFGMFFTAAAFMFIYNGVIYLHKEAKIAELKKNNLNSNSQNNMVSSLKSEQPPGAWYNIVLGISLLVVMLFPHMEWPYIHYGAAAIFFVGSILIMAVLKHKTHKAIGLILASVSAIGLLLHFFDVYSLLYGEWIALTAIAIHYVLEAFSKRSKSGD